MSDKRFTVKSIKNNHYQIAENDLKMLSNEVVDYMNLSSDAIGSLQKKVVEQQATITELESDKAIAEDYANIFEKENVKLRKKLNNYKATVLGFLFIMEENGRISGKDDNIVKDLFKLIDDE